MKNGLELVASLSRFAIAAAIVYFGYQLAQIGGLVSDVTQTVEQVSAQIPPTLDQVGDIRLEVAAIREQIPVILTEVAAVREQVPVVVAEVAGVRAQLPAVLARVDAINRQIDPILLRVDQALREVQETRQLVPLALATADGAVAALNETREQVVPLVPTALDEIRLTREKIDPTLDRVDKMIDDTFVKADRAIADASQAGQKASEGAVKGFFTGLIKLPFQLVGSIASPLVKTFDSNVARQLSERDLELMTQAGQLAIDEGILEQDSAWQNSESGNSGSIAILRLFELQGQDCVEARIRINNRKKEIHNRVSQLCRDESGAWQLAAEVK